VLAAGAGEICSSCISLVFDLRCFVTFNRIRTTMMDAGVKRRLVVVVLCCVVNTLPNSRHCPRAGVKCEVRGGKISQIISLTLNHAYSYLKQVIGDDTKAAACQA